MTIGLTYDSTLGRVEIALSGYEDGSVTIQRSTNQLFWQTVRGGIELPVVGGVASLEDAEFSPDVANFYRTLAVDPEPGLLLPGASGDFASTPDAAALDVTGNIELRTLIASADDWASGASQTLINKFLATGNQRSYRLQITATGGLQLAWSETGADTKSANSTAVVESPTFPIAVRATMDVDDGGNHVIRFHTAPSLAGAWTQLGDAVVNVGTTSIFASTAPLRVGAGGDGTVTFAGVIAAVEVWDGFEGFGGTEVANPDFAAQDSGDTSFTDPAGRTWTVNGAAEIRGEVLEVNSITPNSNGKFWLKVPELPFLNREIDCIISGPIERPSRTGIFQVKGRSSPVAVSDLRGSQQFTLQITTRTLEEARDMDLILAVGKTMLIQVPVEDTSGCGRVMAVPGGYVELGDTVQTKPVPGSRIYTWSLPCVVVNPPGPDVIPTNLIWGTVFDLYGGWDALIASNSTWADLLATVGSPNDPVVL